ncbi:hypothetical protein CIT292_09833 [Citrobacter youngae ATCC 29220]|uniref:Uncharacterized protein n=1 Tax=Citrobacter youngae ATCC 29220 TaxID=500640 RepID=D4BH26_9ENTR|nr:hypothetical protein CIT292_09833 [Citrobacter youngae ATCC 29220]
MFPAPAGINRSISLFAAGRVSVPRASGDKPGILEARKIPQTCSPRQRG